jgi:hypothetical protein
MYLKVPNFAFSLAAAILVDVVDAPVNGTGVHCETEG